MMSIFQRVVLRASSVGPGRKAALGLAATLIAAGAAYASRPRYEPLLIGLSGWDEIKVVSALAPGGLRPRIRPGGTIELPADQIPAARLRLATAGEPTCGLTACFPSGPAILEARDREVSSAVEALEGVAWARVVISAPRARVFQEDAPRPAASVSLVQSEKGVSGRVVASLVCAAVDGMTPVDVVVVERGTLRELWNGGDHRKRS